MNGKHKVEVYELNGHIRGNIVPTQRKLQGEVTWGEPYLAMCVSCSGVWRRAHDTVRSGLRAAGFRG